MSLILNQQGLGMVNKEIHDQGRGVLPSHMVIAEEYLRQNRKKKTDENMIKAIEKLAKEKKESYTPSDDMGKNPESRVSKEVKELMAPFLYDSKRSVINKLGLNQKEQKELMVELNGAINHLTQIVLKRILGFKTKRAKNAELWDPKQITDFEFLASHPKGLSKAQLYAYNAQVAVNRQIRGVIQAWITHALMPVFQWQRKHYYMAFSEVYKKATPQTVRSKNVYHNLMKHMAKNLSVTFGKSTLIDYIMSFRVASKNIGASKKSLPPGKS